VHPVQCGLDGHGLRHSVEVDRAAHPDVEGKLGVNVEDKGAFADNESDEKASEAPLLSVALLATAWFLTFV